MRFFETGDGLPDDFVVRPQYVHVLAKQLFVLAFCAYVPISGLGQANSARLIHDGFQREAAQERIHRVDVADGDELGLVKVDYGGQLMYIELVFIDDGRVVLQGVLPPIVLPHNLSFVLAGKEFARATVTPSTTAKEVA
jgi:hypothetical protein